MSYLKPYDPSADYVVVKGFIESGKAYQEGDDYVPRFDSRKRKFRHYVARRIARKDVVESTEEVLEPVVEDVVEESTESPDFENIIETDEFGKTELDAYAATFGITLNRRFSFDNMLEAFKEEWLSK